MKKWYLLYSTASLPHASIIKGMLEENNVPVIIINRQDSSYLNFGEIEVYVPLLLKDVAKHLLDQALLN
jgi:hypothetical protein